jgi:hypothetical protein
MSPKFLEQNGYTFFIYSKEEQRCHVHVRMENRKAKYWMEPTIELAENKGFKAHELVKIEKIIIENERYFKDKWDKHFKG